MREPDDAVLSVRDLHKRFGALAVTDGVSFDIAPAEIRALIGPNGAGKTTLIAQLFGELRSDRGQVFFAGRDLAGIAPAGRTQMGLARSFQITNLLGSLSVRENVAVARAGRGGAFPNPFRGLLSDAALKADADALLERVGLGRQADVAARHLAYGDQRALEIAMGLALQPRLILLDEPLAGTGPEESARIIDLLRSIKGTLAVLLVEHDMDAVWALADRVTVLAEGRVVASGAPEAVRRDPAVRAAYLGDDEALAA